MIKITQLKLHAGHSQAQLEKKVRSALRLREEDKLEIEIAKQSIDARHKPDIFYVYTVLAKVANESAVLKKLKKDKNISQQERVVYRFPGKVYGEDKEFTGTSPVIVGAGPAGLFCALLLARAGSRPILLERGKAVEERSADVESFWESGVLNPESNVQFGEGGAGTFSDGKLNTGIKDPEGRIRFVLEEFVKAGADPEILYSYKPHIGTDVLRTVVKNIREEIKSLGGEVRFQSRLDKITEGTSARYLLQLGDGSTLEADDVVLALGHSARDTFAMLYEAGFEMTAKAFAVGVRVQHPQAAVDLAMYGSAAREDKNLPPSPYKLTHKCQDGRGVYSFCMCPGGYVVNASSEEGRLAVNGMSYHDRGSENANSAIVVTVSPEDYGAKEPLDGIKFQRELEEKAFKAGNGKIPAQTFADFCKKEASTKLGAVNPIFRGGYVPADVRSIFPDFVGEDIEEGMKSFERQIPGFSNGDTILAGVESRTSSPVRIERDENGQSQKFPGVYPCGEGAGYAGGITSAAVDGMRIAEKVAMSLENH